MKKVKTLIVLVMFVLSSCNSIDDGVIINKKHSPSFIIMVRNYQPNKYGGSCYTVPVYINEMYVIEIQKIIKNDTEKRNIRVSEKIYNSLIVGNYFNKNSNK
jgi:hypothetical protein